MIVKLHEVTPLLQRNFGGTMDCSLTSMTTLLMYEFNRKNANYVYDQVEFESKKHLYSPEKHGLVPFCIKEILNGIMSRAPFNSLKRKAKSGYIKGIGFTFNKIKKIIDSGHIIILNVTKLGKYKDHSITIVGYGTDKTVYIYDNWDTVLHCEPFSSIGMFSSINWVE